MASDDLARCCGKSGLLCTNRLGVGCTRSALSGAERGGSGLVRLGAVISRVSLRSNVGVAMLASPKTSPWVAIENKGALRLAWRSMRWVCIVGFTGTLKCPGVPAS